MKKNEYSLNDTIGHQNRQAIKSERQHKKKIKRLSERQPMEFL